MKNVWNTVRSIWPRWGGWIEGGLVALAAWVFLGRYDRHAESIGDMEHWFYEKMMYALLLGGFAAAIGIALRLNSALKQRDRALEAFRGSRDLYRHIVENANEMIFEVDTMGKITYVNKAGERFMGYPVAELLGKQYSDFVLPSHKASVQRAFVVQATRKIPVLYLEAPALSKNGAVIWFGQNVKLKLIDGALAGFSVISRDVTDRREAEQALRSREETIRAIFKQAPLGMVLTDVTGKLLTMNDRYAEMTGYSVEELSGKSFMEITHPDDLLETARLFNGLIEDRSDSYHLEKKYIRKDGTMFWGRVAVSKLRLQDDDKTFAIAMVEDIDEWKRSEERNMQLQSIIEETSDIIATADQRGYLTYLNPAGRRLLGVGDEESVEGLSPRAFFEEEMIGEIKGVVQRAVAAEGRWQGRMPLRSRDGSGVMVSQVILGHRNEKGALDYLSTIARDITKEYAAQMDLERERELLRTLIEAIPDEIAIKDRERKFILANSAAVRALKQVGIEDILGKKDEDLIREPFATIAREEEEEMLASGKALFNRTSNPKRDPVTGKALRALLVTKIPLKDKDGNVDKIVVVNRDVTDLRRAEDERELMISDLQKALADVKTLSGLLPICASCKKIRDDDGYWNKIESFIETHTAAQFSHGLCPECIGQYFPGSSSARSGETTKQENRES